MEYWSLYLKWLGKHKFNPTNTFNINNYKTISYSWDSKIETT